MHEQPTALSPSQRFSLGLSGVLASLNDYRHDQLHPSEATAESKAEAMTILSRDWKINTAEDLDNTLTWLTTGGGQNKDFMAMLTMLTTLESRARTEFIESRRSDEEHYAQLRIVAHALYRLQNAGIFAWDSGRYVMLCRWSAMIGLITDEQAWKAIYKLARQVQPLFPDWYTYGLSYVTGRHFWQASRSREHATYLMQQIMKLMADENAPWRIPWDTDLSQGCTSS